MDPFNAITQKTTKAVNKFQQSPLLILSLNRLNFCLKSILILSALFLLPGKAMSDTLLDAVKVHRKSHKQANLEITQIVTRFIPNGCSEELAMETLLKNDFRVYRRDSRKNDDEVEVIAVRKPSTVHGFGDEIQIGFSIRDRQVHEVWGMLIYRAL